MKQNGIAVRGYLRKRAGKRKMKDKYAKTFYYGSGEGSWSYMLSYYRDYEKDKKGHHPLDYWKTFYLSGPRQYAKHATNSLNRAHWRDYSKMILGMDPEDLEDLPKATRGNITNKTFDYDWTVW